MEVRYKPLWDRVWVKKLEEEETKSPGGLVLPGKENKNFTRGYVIETGCGHRMRTDHTGVCAIELEVDPGDKVIFSKYAGTDLGDGTVILKEDEILAIEKQN